VSLPTGATTAIVHVRAPDVAVQLLPLKLPSLVVVPLTSTETDCDAVDTYCGSRRCAARVGPGIEIDNAIVVVPPDFALAVVAEGVTCDVVDPLHAVTATASIAHAPR
jgi:hypothetical protein